MATLFERLIGQNIPDSPAPEDEKIAIHAFIGALFENQQGYLSGADAVAMFNLTASQTSDAQTLIDLASSAPNKIAFMRVFKDWMYLGETQADDRYLSQANLVQRLQDEVTDQGGTLP